MRMFSVKLLDLFETVVKLGKLVWSRYGVQFILSHSDGEQTQNTAMRSTQVCLCMGESLKTSYPSLSSYKSLRLALTSMYLWLG